jgi:hypothetical protein
MVEEERKDSIMVPRFDSLCISDTDSHHRISKSANTRKSDVLLIWRERAQACIVLFSRHVTESPVSVSFITMMISRNHFLGLLMRNNHLTVALLGIAFW